MGFMIGLFLFMLFSMVAGGLYLKFGETYFTDEDGRQAGAIVATLAIVISTVLFGGNFASDYVEFNSEISQLKFESKGNYDNYRNAERTIEDLKDQIAAIEVNQKAINSAKSIAANKDHEHKIELTKLTNTLNAKYTGAVDQCVKEDLIQEGKHGAFVTNLNSVHAGELEDLRNTWNSKLNATVKRSEAVEADLVSAHKVQIDNLKSKYNSLITKLDANIAILTKDNTVLATKLKTIRSVFGTK